ncbi:hypothetical protein [Anaerovorax sp. IOR16]|uniref:hypothetical protein n=1 Tax=Anaerovorax sp. IOR16 TaxID=2773458 RepID=UPI0019D2582E|nr:hypothetical protein [Anaerovorax sp. IOR16]
MKGQVFIRKTGQMINGKEAVIIAGIVTLDALEDFTIQTETQYTISNATLSEPINRREEARGNAVDSILRMPIWRV